MHWAYCIAGNDRVSSRKFEMVGWKFALCMALSMEMQPQWMHTPDISFLRKAAELDLLAPQPKWMHTPDICFSTQGCRIGICWHLSLCTRSTEDFGGVPIMLFGVEAEEIVRATQAEPDGTRNLRSRSHWSILDIVLEIEIICYHSQSRSFQHLFR